MTKVRSPLTYDSALAKIAGLIGYEAMAAAVGQKDRTVRDWGDPDIERGCPIEAAELLDLAYQAAGGEGTPLCDTLTLRLDAARRSRSADLLAIARGTCTLSREGAEAIEALILFTLPGASERQRLTALRELEEFVAAGKALLPLIQQAQPPPNPP